MMRRKRGALVGLMICAYVCMTGCDESNGAWQDPGPDETLRAFLMNLYFDKGEQAWAQLVPEDRAHFEKTRAAIAALGVVEVPDADAMLLRRRVVSPYAIKSMAVQPELTTQPKVNDAVTVTMSYQDGRTAKAKMRWDGSAWLVVLRDAT